MNMEFKRKLPIPKDIKEMFPISEEYVAKREQCNNEVKAILNGSDDRLLMVIGPCSADNEEAVLDYLLRLRKVQDKVKDKILIIPENLYQQAKNNRKRLQRYAPSAGSTAGRRYAERDHYHS